MQRMLKTRNNEKNDFINQLKNEVYRYCELQEQASKERRDLGEISEETREGLNDASKRYRILEKLVLYEDPVYQMYKKDRESIVKEEKERIRKNNVSFQEARLYCCLGCTSTFVSEGIMNYRQWCMVCQYLYRHRLSSKYWFDEYKKINLKKSK